MVRDPQLIKDIAVKDFDHFRNHRIFLDPENGGLSISTLFVLQDQKWKDMRGTLTPAFTGSKMRLMLGLITEVAEQAINFIKHQNNYLSGYEVDAKEFFTRVTNDAIASTAFGMKIDSLSDKSNEFYMTGKAITKFTVLQQIRFFVLLCFRPFAKYLKIKVIAQKYDDYFLKIVKDAMAYRKENNIDRNDLINILMDAKGLSVSGNTKKPTREWTDEELTAQCLFFFFAGFENVANVLSFAAHELMANPRIQKRLIKEIEDVRKELDGKSITYELLNDMKYLDAVINETLRKWPPAPLIDRVCNEDYVVDSADSKILIKKGESLFFPVAGINYDPTYFCNPEQFDPDRFYDQKNINENAFIPFGVGPRKCIAYRFATMETKAILFNILSHFTFREGVQSHIPIILESGGFSMNAKHGFWIKVVPNNSSEHEDWMNS